MVGRSARESHPVGPAAASETPPELPRGRAQAARNFSGPAEGRLQAAQHRVTAGDTEQPAIAWLVTVAAGERGCRDNKACCPRGRLWSSVDAPAHTRAWPASTVARTAPTGWANSKHLFVTVLDAGRPKVKELAGLVSGENPSPGS